MKRVLKWLSCMCAVALVASLVGCVPDESTDEVKSMSYAYGSETAGYVFSQTDIYPEKEAISLNTSDESGGWAELINTFIDPERNVVSYKSEEGYLSLVDFGAILNNVYSAFAGLSSSEGDTWTAADAIHEFNDALAKDPEELAMQLRGDAMRENAVLSETLSSFEGIEFSPLVLYNGDNALLASMPASELDEATFESITSYIEGIGDTEDLSAYTVYFMLTKDMKSVIVLDSRNIAVRGLLQTYSQKL